MTETALQRGRLSDEELIRSSDLFDVDYYLATYPDVAAAKVDPVKHYLGSGTREGRDPSESFSTRAYLRRYPDVQATGWNPLVHYLRLGEAEGRLSNPLLDDAELVAGSGMFDETYYREMRPDLPADVDAVLHYIENAAEDGTDPSEQFSTTGYLRQYPGVISSGMNPLVHYLREGLPVGRSAPVGRPLHTPVHQLIAEQWPRLQPFPVVRVTGVGPRITVLTDRVDEASLFGDVGTALIVGMSLANRYGASLRIATTADPPDPGVLGPLQQGSGVVLHGDVELAHLPSGGSPQPLLMGDHDVIVTTSWTTTRSVLGGTLERDEIVYLLQEDERTLYPHGDERLLCSETLAESVTTLVSSGRLLAHLISDVPRLAHDGISFEPASPGYDVSAARETADRRNFLFYARTHTDEHLFWRGLAALARAVEDGVLDPDEWAFHFVGGAIPKLSLPFDVRPEMHLGQDWLAYQSLVGRTDAGMVLVDTPHLSQPLLDQASVGAAVLTSRPPGHSDLADLSGNIVASDLALPSLVEGLGRVAALGADPAARRQHRDADNISRDWTSTLAPALDALDQRLHRRLGRGGHVH